MPSFFPRFLSLLCLVFLTFAISYAQGDRTASDSAAKPFLQKSSLVVLPIVFYTPETRWAFGAGAFAAFRFRGESKESRPSQAQLGGAYTLEKQVLSYLSYRLFWQENRFTSFGEVGYYRYTYFYFGIGNDPAAQTEELYDVVFPRVRWHGLRQLQGSDWYVGPTYWYDGYQITETEVGGKLADSVNVVPGSRGGRISGPGVMALYDSRDKVFFPSSGTFAEVYGQVYGRFTGSAFSYRRFKWQASHFRNTWRKHVLAMQAFGDWTFGDVPFYAMAQLGGGKQMRGYYEGRYRDKMMWGAQVEYRAPLFWRIAVVGFAGVAAVGPNLGKLASAPLRPAFGGGLRFLLSEDDKVYIRADYGFGPGTSGIYLTVGEAF